MTKTVQFVANTIWSEAASGPKDIIFNPSKGHTEIYIGNTAPSNDVSNTFLVKAVAGENYLNFSLETGDKLYVKTVSQNGATVSWIEKATSP